MPTRIARIFRARSASGSTSDFPIRPRPQGPMTRKWLSSGRSAMIFAQSLRSCIGAQSGRDSEMDVKEIVKEKYGKAALRASAGQGSDCCGSTASGCCESADPITSNLYDALQKSELPETAVLASLGCGNPTALAELMPGEIVLDL